MIPIIIVILLAEMENREILAFIIFVLAAITDAVDGYVARKYNEVSDLGKFLDPLADKLLVSAALIALVYLNLVATWVATILILREIVISTFRFYSLTQKSSFGASIPAKLKTTLQVVAIAILIIHRKLPFSSELKIIATYLLYIAVAFSLYSGGEYLLRMNKILKK